MTQTPRKNQGFGRSFAMTPGVRTIPAAMVLPTAAAMPNHTPRTRKSFPPEILERGEGGVAGRAAKPGGASGILGNRVVQWFRDRGHDNGGEGKYKAQVIGRGGNARAGTRGGAFNVLLGLRSVLAGNRELIRCCRCRVRRAKRFGL